MSEWNVFGRGFDSRRLHHYTVDNPFLQDHSPGGRVLFLPLYSRPLANLPSFKTILLSPDFYHFPALHSLFGPRFSVLFGPGPIRVRKAISLSCKGLREIAFWVVVLSPHPVLLPDLFFEPTVRRTEKKRNQSKFPAIKCHNYRLFVEFKLNALILCSVLYIVHL